MKRFAAIFLVAVCTLSLAACGNQKPSLDEVEKAISEGNVTVEDALEKGWVTQEWADEYQEKNSVPASDKSTTYAVGEFTAQTISGTEFTRDDLKNATYIAFLDPTNEDTPNFYEEMCKAYDKVKELGGDMVACIKSEDTEGIFADAPFPVILYNDSLEKALPEGTSDMLKELPNTGNWYANGYLCMAWTVVAEEDSFVDTAEMILTTDFLNPSSNDNDSTEDSGEAAGMVG